MSVCIRVCGHMHIRIRRAAPQGRGAVGDSMLPVVVAPFTVQIPPFASTADAHTQLLEAARIAIGDLHNHAL